MAALVAAGAMSLTGTRHMKGYGLLAIVIGIFAVAMFHSLRDIRTGQSTAVEVTALNYWNASQARFELERTIATLDAFMGGAGGVTKDDLISRVDIFWSRLPILYEGEQGRSLAEVTHSDQIAPDIMKRIDQMNADLLSLDLDDRQAYADLRQAFVSFRQPLQEILLQVHQVYDSGYFTLHREMERLYDRHKMLLIGTLFSGTILILFLLRSTRRAELAHRAAHDARDELETVINALPLSVDAVDKDGRLVLLNDNARRVCCVGGDWTGQRPSEIGMDPANDRLNREVFATGRPVEAMELCADRPNLPKRTWLTSKVPVKDQGGHVRKVITVGIDITERKQAEARIRHLAHHDVLTGLYNRAFFQERLASALSETGEKGGRLALLYIDFDRFKDVNDRLGHEVGDLFLIEAGRRLERSLPEAATISRLGGDEFAVIHEHVGDAGDTRLVAEQLISAFEDPVRIGGESWLSTISIGVSMSISKANTPEQLLREADLALYEAKAKGGNTLCFYTPEMRSRQRTNSGIQQRLRNAIAEEALVLHYQPKIRLRDHRLSGCEALLRWNHPQYGPIPPSTFIPAAENCDLIVVLGQMVLEAACAQIAAWQNEDISPPPVAINMSAAQFMRQDVAALIEQALDATGIPPDLLEVEVTETILIDNSETVLNTLSRLRAMGIGVTLDDFGTGYSSLSYLQRFPIDKIKIDKAFVQPIARARGDLAIVRAIIAMAHSLGISVVAEGVETKAQCDLLATMGCDEVQGFLISHARQPGHLAKWLEFGVTTSPIGSLSNARHDVVPLYPSGPVGVRTIGE